MMDKDIELKEYKEVMTLLKVMGGIYIGVCAIQAIGLIAIACILSKYSMFMQMSYYCR